MKRTFLIIGIILTGLIMAQAQAAPQKDEVKERENEKRADFNNRIDNLRNVGKDRIIRDRYRDAKIFEDKVKPIYREPTSEERELIEPEPADLEKYSGFLRQKDTGLVKLITDRGCDKGIDIIVSTPHCLKYSLPGGGTSYSFREENYRKRRFSDISFSNNRFYSKGLLVQGIFVDIGNVPLEQVDMNTPGLRFISEFEPSTDMDEIVDFNLKLEKGIEQDSFTYQLSAPVYDNTTYVLRSVAYRGEIYRSVEGINYNEFDYDKRKDITVAFRVVSYQPGKGITILWKMLDERKAPKIKIDK